MKFAKIFLADQLAENGRKLPVNKGFSRTVQLFRHRIRKATRSQVMHLGVNFEMRAKIIERGVVY